jgi:hypothetical protein
MATVKIIKYQVVYDCITYILCYILAEIHPTSDIRMTYSYEKRKYFAY